MYRVRNGEVGLVEGFRTGQILKSRLRRKIKIKKVKTANRRCDRCTVKHTAITKNSLVFMWLWLLGAAACSKLRQALDIQLLD